MPDCLAAADLVLCRAGASTLAELKAAGKPAILIPSPNVAENHQYKNALSLAEADAAFVFEEKELDPEAVAGAAAKLIGDRELRDRMGANARGLCVPDSAEIIARRIIELGERNEEEKN